jgi:hypothetical protein
VPLLDHRVVELAARMPSAAALVIAFLASGRLMVTMMKLQCVADSLLTFQLLK